MQGKYYEAVVSEIDPANKTVTASFPEDAGLDSFSFTVPYDILILGMHAPLTHTNPHRSPGIIVTIDRSLTMPN